MSKIKPDIEKYCISCGQRIKRNRMPNGHLEDYGDYKRRKHCNRKCMGKSNLPRGKKATIISKAGYIAIYSPNHPNKNKWGYVNEHILIAEKAFGKPLPPGAEIHHINGTRNSGALVICQDHAYHLMIHRRERALKACGHPNWRKCTVCKEWDMPENMSIPKNPRGHIYHKKCAAKAQRERDSLK